MARRSDKRGFGSMDPERRRRIASEGGRASHGGRRGREEDWDEYENEDEDYENTGYQDEEEDWEDENEGAYGNASYDDYEDEGYEEEEEDEDDYDRGRRGGSRRGFGSMPREEVRRIASKGGRSRGS